MKPIKINLLITIVIMFLLSSCKEKALHEKLPSSQNTQTFKNDTISVKPSDLKINKLKTGKLQYIMYIENSKDGLRNFIMLLDIDVKKKKHNNKNAIEVDFKWLKDTIDMQYNSVLSTKNLSMLQHKYYRNSSKFSVAFDFQNRKVEYHGNPNEASKLRVEKNFSKSFEQYSLNWNYDLLFLPLLPFKENAVFKINFYDPPYEPQDVYYSVIGSEILTDYSGKRVNCWILETEIDIKYGGGFQRFWISKKNRNLIKEEDFYEGNKMHRYKIKLGFTKQE